MIAALVKVANRLDSLGLTAEADLLDSFIFKIAAPPLEGFVPMDKWEPVDFGGEEDEEGNPIPRRFDRIPRSKKILRDRRSREYLKHEMKRKSLPLEEQEEAEVAEWYKAISNLGDSVILIPFDKEDLERNDEALMALGHVFGVDASNYKDLFEKVNMISGRNTRGSVETFKALFPALWSDIEEIIAQKKLNEDNVIFMLYNQANSPIRSLFTKDPSFFGHDMGHNVFDSEDGDWEFKGILNNFIFKIYALYLSETDEDAGEERTSAVEELGDEDDSTMMAQLPNFFSNTSGPEDSYGDVFGAVASGTLVVDIPETITNFDTWYHLPPENRGPAEALVAEVTESLKKYLNSNYQYGTRGSGPLSYFEGHVVLNDV